MGKGESMNIPDQPDNLFSRFWIADGIYSDADVIRVWYPRVENTRKKLLQLYKKVMSDPTHISSKMASTIYDTGYCIGLYKVKLNGNKRKIREWDGRIFKEKFDLLKGQEWKSIASQFQEGWNIVLLSPDAVKWLNMLASLYSPKQMPQEIV